MAELNRELSAHSETLAAPSADVVSGVVSTTPSSNASSAAASGQRARLANRYELLGLVGVGGMGTVYRARDTELDETVAIKVLRREISEAEGMLDRFRREVKLARKVTHHNVARVFDIGEHQGEKFLTMEFVDGESLATHIARQGPLDVAQTVEIASGICAGLAGAHAAGVVHRDLKPDNVLLAKDGRVVLTDFGIARAFEGSAVAAHTVGLMLGTPAYMAPEQVEGKHDVGARADIYALGAVLYEMLTGHRAWHGESPFAVAAARLFTPPPDLRVRRPELSAACADLVLRCMALAPEDRYAGAAAVAEELAALVPHEGSANASKHAGTIVAKELSPTATRVTPVGLTPPQVSREKTVAVLPFRNAGPAEDAYLAEEITDDLIDGLSMTRGLRVSSRGTVHRYRGTEHDPREVGKDLGVQVVVEGSVRRASGRLRVSARLVSVADGFQLWAKRFDRPERDALAINDEAAKAIAEALTLDHDAKARAAPSNGAAIDLYLRGRNEYRNLGMDHQQRAIELFDQALAIAPGDPLILAAKAMSLARFVFFSGTRGIEARAVAEQAVAAAPDLGDARLALGTVLLQLGDGVGAIRQIKLAVQKSPTLAEAHGTLGRLLVELGALDEGIRRLEAAVALDDHTPLAQASLLRAYALRGDWTRAERLLASLRTTEGENGYWTAQLRLLLWHGERGRTAEIAAGFVEQIPVNSHPLLQLMRLAFRSIAAGDMLPELDVAVFGNDEGHGPRRRAFFRQLESEMCAFFGMRDRSLAALRHSTEAGLLDLGWLDRCPLFDDLRGDARFGEIRAEISRRADAMLGAYRAA